MMLQPRNFKFKNNQNGRSVMGWRNSSLSYGDCGLRVLRPLRMSANRIFRLNVYLNNAVNNPDLTKRSVWFNIFPHMPLTNNPNGTSMGNGSGKLNTWAVHLGGGAFILEFNNLRPGRARYFFNNVVTNITVPTTVTFKSLSVFTVNGPSSTSSWLSSYDN